MAAADSGRPIARVVQQNGLGPGTGSHKGFLSLLAGILRMSIVQSTRADDFGIPRPTAIASLRSTDWIVEAGGGAVRAVDVPERAGS